MGVVDSPAFAALLRGAPAVGRNYLSVSLPFLAIIKVEFKRPVEQKTLYPSKKKIGYIHVFNTFDGVFPEIVHAHYIFGVLI